MVAECLGVKGQGPSLVIFMLEVMVGVAARR
jgi:hypothetical protein